MKHVDTVAFIFARGGSKGLPGKNLLPFVGKPLLAWAIEQAKAVSRIRRVIVSTDAKEIADTAVKYGAEVPFLRPAELATDDAPEWLAWRHALTWLEKEEGKIPEAMVSVPPTSPLRSPKDIEACLDEFGKGDVDAVITVTEANRNPWFNMVTINNHGNAQIAAQLGKSLVRRQDAPEVFDMTTVAYVVCPLFLMRQSNIFSGRVRAVKIPRERAVDIDTILDFQFAEFLAQIRKTKNL